jgi:transcription initiation factor TFIIIB Brf1 subunit/transcription initiation factor TFIIB
MESAITNTLVRALQELKIATYDSVRWFDRTYTVDSYKKALWDMEAKEQVKRRVFQAGKNERYVWFLPWYEDDANDKIEELVQEVVAHLAESPSTPGELRQYFRENHPAYHQIGYLALRAAVVSGRVVQYTFNDGTWKTIYHLPETDDLQNLESHVMQYVSDNGFAFAQDLSESLKISRSLAYKMLAKLAYDGKITRFKVAWNYLRNVPIFAYCKEGYEARAVARYRQLVQARLVQRKRDRLVEDYFSKFKGATSSLRADESLTELAGSYFEKLLKSGFVRGRETAAVAWSAYFLASKILRQGITPGDIESYAKIGKTPKPNNSKRGWQRKTTPLLNTAKDANDFLELSAPDLYSRPNDYLEKIVSKMKLTETLVSSNGLTRREELLQDTASFVSKLPRELFFGKRSESLAATALYMVACRLGIGECTQHRISEAADVTEVTVRNTMHSIVSALLFETDSNEIKDLQWVEMFGSEGAAMKAKGLARYTDENGRKKWGTPEEIRQSNVQSAMARLFGRVMNTKEEENVN